MANSFNALSASARWRVLVDAAKQGAVDEGYKLRRVPGRGLSNVWNLEKNGKSQMASIRTTRDLWFAFQPEERGKKWKTLGEVDQVIVASVDSKDDPQNVEVYIFPAKEVVSRFNAAYTARVKDGQVVKDGFGMWVGLHKDPRGVAASVGSGLADQYKPVGVYPIEELLSARPDDDPDEDQPEATDEQVVGERALSFGTIAEVMAWARERVAVLAGVRVEAVKLDLKVEY